MYYIKKIFLTGNGVETSGVDLTPGLNIIYTVRNWKELYNQMH